MQILAHSRQSQSRHQMYFGMAGWFIVTFAAAAVGTRASIHAAGFYGQLVRPAWAPSASVFGPVWTVLYLMMAYSAWRVWARAGSNSAYVALTLYLVQLALNALWSWFFFEWHLGGVAFTDIVLLWLVLVSMLVAFSRHSKAAALLQVPYLLWISFAAALNYSVWQLNPQMLK